MVSSARSIGLQGLDGFAVEVEVNLSSGLPAFELVGLAGQAVRESRERVRAAVKNSGFSFPLSRITVNLAPADIPKEGPVYDLPILAALLAAAGEIPPLPRQYALAGELSLSGGVRPVRGLLPMAVEALRLGFTHFFVPEENAAEAAVAEGLCVVPVRDADALVRMLRGEAPIEAARPAPLSGGQTTAPDFSDVRGQEGVRRACEIAAAGGHNLLMIGPPGSGKSMIARRIPGILPEMTPAEALETAKIHSLAGLLPREGGLLSGRPFRAPHHTCSAVALTGGGSIPRPGEVSLAHGGVLFLDELPEFPPAALEALRQPLEDGTVTVSRARASVTYPAGVTLVAAMNPCRCGYFGHPTRACTCSRTQVQAYLGRISGPLLDRIDLHVEVPPVTAAQMEDASPAESSQAIRARVTAARDRQRARYAGLPYCCNAQLDRAGVARFCGMTAEGAALLRDAYGRLSLSARAHDRILKTARTVADLAGAEQIGAAHIAEALSLRAIDQKYFGGL